MATQTEILKIEVDSNGAKQNVTELTTAIEGTKKATKDLEAENNRLAKSGKQTSQQYKDNAELIALNKAELQKLNTQRKREINTAQAQKGSLTDLRNSLAKLTEQRNRDLAVGSKSFNQANKNILSLNKQIKAAEEQGGDFRRSVGGYSEAIEGATGNLSAISPAIGGFTQRILSATKAAIAFIATPLGAVLAAIGLAVGALTQYFRDNEDGQNRLNKISNQLAAVWGILTDTISDLGKALFDAFDNPREALLNFGELIKQNLINRFTGFIDLLGNGKDIIANSFKIMAGKIKLALADVPIIGKAIDVESVQKDIDTATTDISKNMVDFANNTIKATTGVDDALGKIKEGYQNIQKEAETRLNTANKLSDRQAQIDKEERKQLVERARLETEVAELRLKAKDEENFTNQERLDFLREAQTLNDQIFKREEELARERLLAKQEENSLSNSTKEDLKEEAQLKADLIKVEKQRSDANRRIQTEITTANNKAQADVKKQEEAEFNLALFREEQAAKDVEGIQEKANAEIEIERFKLEQLLSNEALSETEKQLLKEQSLARELEIQAKADKDLEKLREKDEKSFEESEKKKENIRKQRIQNGLDLTQAAVGLASEILGRETKAGKALAITAAGINTAQAITKTLAQYGGTPLGYAQAAAVGATGAVQIAKMKSSDTSGDNTPPTPPTPTPTPNLLTSNVDNQITQQEALIVALESQRFQVSVTEINDVQNAVNVSENDSTI